MSDSAADQLTGAQRAVETAQHQPHATFEFAVQLLAGQPPSPEVEATACWAGGLALRELNRLPEADKYLSRAIDVATAAGLPRVAAGGRTTRALVLTNLGRADAGLAELDLAEPALDGAELARVRMQRALIMQRLGRLDEALLGFEQALPGLVAGNDRLAETRLRINRGIALTYRNELTAADNDLRRARVMADELGQSMLVAACSHNLGFLHGRRGDVPLSLGWFDRANDDYSQLGVEAGLSAVLLADRAEVLLDAGLNLEALRCSRRALGLLGSTANTVEYAEAQLTVARAALAAGNHHQAATHAAVAAELFTTQSRSAWAALADYVAFISADVGRTNRPSTADVDRAQAVALGLANGGWALEAAAACGMVGRLALAAGDSGRAHKELTVAAEARLSGSAVYRVSGWYAEALLRVNAGNRGGARRAIRAGLGIIDRHRATFGAADLRAHVAAHGDRLADLLVQLAIDGGKARDILAAAEAWRAGALSVPVTPSDDPDLAQRLSALRAVAAGRRGGDATEPHRELARLEGEIRDLVRTRTARSGDHTHLPTFHSAKLLDRLGERMLVEWVVYRGQLHVIWAVDGRIRWSPLEQASAVLPELDSARMCLHRLARAAGSQRSLDAAQATLTIAQTRLSQLLFGPIAGQAAERELVLVPTGMLHRIPWSAIDLVRGRPYVVAPSARSWLAATNAAETPRSNNLLLAAGPGLPGATVEVQTLARRRPDATVLLDGDATVGQVLAHLQQTSIAHLAAHGVFRTDNPQFSSLQFADGDLTVYDLGTLPRVPAVLVLSACDAGAITVRPGDELLGLSAALLAMGATSLIAPSVPVPDDATVGLMVALQQHLAAGHQVPVALCLAIQESEHSDDPRTRGVTRSFVALGA